MAAPPADEPQWLAAVKPAFPNSDLPARMLQSTSAGQHNLPALFADIAQYVVNLRNQSAPGLDPQPHSKKRKLEDDEKPASTAQANGTSGASIASPTVAYDCADVSFQVPARKKLKLQIVADSSNTQQQEVRLVQPATGQVEYTLPSTQIDEVFCLPVPEKQQRQWNFLVFPLPGTVSAEGAPKEQIVFTMNETAPTSAQSAAYTPNENDTYITVTELELARMLQSQGKRVVIPTADEFASSIPQSHRKGEKAYHVKAHRGSKEGYLFFLANGIVFGFKKPLAFYPFSAIESISYTSVLQRTFNLVIAATEPASADPASSAAAADPIAKEIEFSMIDQADFAGIDEYVKRHGLNDASMAAERRAKAYNVNKPRRRAAESNGDAAGEEGAEDGQTELQKAEQQLQDEEDEEEEDYEASGGESDGEGEYSSDEDDDGEGYAEEGEEEDGEGEEEGDEEEADVS